MTTYESDSNVSRRSVLKGIAGATTAGALGAASTGTASAAIGDSAVYQYYHTRWNDIRNDLSTLADQGYDAIQVPPAQESKLSFAEREYDSEIFQKPAGYQPINHKNFDSEFGTESEYRAMVDEAHYYGLDVIADAVMNHMAAGVNFDQFPHFGYNDFHHNGGIEDYDDEWQVKNCDLEGLPDLKQESSYVRGQLKEYLDKYADLGVDGIRFDAAKHMPEWFFEDHVTQWADDRGLYKLGEVLNGSLSYCQSYANTGMSVTDYPLYYTMKEDVFHGYGDMNALDGAGLVNQSAHQALTFVSNHDSRPPEYERLAYAFILTYEGYPRVYSHRIGVNDGEIRNLLWIRNNLLGGAAHVRHVDTDLFVFDRGDALVALNRGGGQRSQWVYTDIGANQSLSDCTDTMGNVSTNGDSWVELTIPARDYVVYSTACHDGIQDGATYRIINVESGRALDVEGGTSATSNGADVHQWDYLGNANQHWTAHDLGGGYYGITAQHSRNVLDVSGGESATDNGANVHQWEWLGNENQQWAIESTSKGYRLVARHSGKVLDAPGTDNGSSVHQWDWHGGDNQHWRFERI
jgi:alpha-amylase